MSDGSLSQEEIDALLQGADDLGSAFEEKPATTKVEEGLSSSENSEIISLANEAVQSMGMTLSTITGKNVNISNPQVAIVNKDRYVSELDERSIEIGANFTEAFTGKNAFIVPGDLAKQIASIMMAQEEGDLTEMAISAVSEAFNQMIASLATTIEDNTGNHVRIEPVNAVVKELPGDVETPKNNFVMIRSSIGIEGKTTFLDEIMDLGVAKSIANGMLRKKGKSFKPFQQAPAPAQNTQQFEPVMGVKTPSYSTNQSQPDQPSPQQNVGIQPVQFAQLNNAEQSGVTGNIGLLMDVSMQLTVELGRTKMLIKDILGMGEGTIVELDKLAGEPVDLLVNGKLIAKGEVVVIDENFGVRVTDIISPMERIANIE